MFECTYNENGILKTVKYKDSYIKHTIKTIFIIYVVMIILILALLILYYKIGFSIYIPIFCSAVFLLGSGVFWIIYFAQKRFSLTFEEDQLCMKGVKKNVIIPYSSVKTYGVLYRVGPNNLISVVMGVSNSYYYYSDSKSTVFFSTNQGNNLSKLSRTVITDIGRHHGFFKDSIFYISDYSNSLVLKQCVKAIKYHTHKYSPEVINMDRKELKNKAKKG